MADNASTTAADMPNQAQQDSPFMKLPTELRLRIYKFTFDDIVDDIAADTAQQQHVRVYKGPGELWSPPTYKEHPAFFGVLGLLHTSRELRGESLDALLAHAKAYETFCCNHYNIVLKEYRKRPNFDDRHERDEWKRVNPLRKLAFNEAIYQRERMYLIHGAIDHVGFMAKIYGETSSPLIEHR